MKINFKQPVVSIEGEALKNGETPIDLGWCSVQALMALYNDERELQGEEKLKRYQLASKIQKSKETDGADLTVEEVAKLKTLIGKHFSASVVGPCWEMLEKPTELKVVKEG